MQNLKLKLEKQTYKIKKNTNFETKNIRFNVIFNKLYFSVVSLMIH